MVVPKAHDQDVATSQRLSHGAEASLNCVVINVIEGNLVVLAEILSNGVVWLKPINVHDRVFNDISILDILAADFDELPGVSAIRGDKLCDNSHHTAAVYGEP